MMQASRTGVEALPHGASASLQATSTRAPWIRAASNRLARALALSFFLAVLPACPPPVSPACQSVVCDDGLQCVTEQGEGVCRPPADPCGVNNPCDAESEVCLVRANGGPLCTPRSKCADVTCNVGERCEPTTGECVDDGLDCRNGTCPVGFSCNENSGLCEENSKACSVCCGDYEVCNPALGECVPDLCTTTASANNPSRPLLCDCGPSQVCNPIDGGCLDLPSRCGSCESNQYCDDKSGLCVTIPSTVPATGEIGAACTSSANCSRSGAYGFCIEDGGLFGPMPGGSCSASCDVVGCPSGAACVDVGLSVCLDVCLSDDECREGYGCFTVTAGDPKRYCFPRGAGGSQCTGPDCAPIGSSCAEDDDCLAGGSCQRNLPGGYCVKNNCNRNLECRGEQDGCLCLGTDSCSDSTLALATCDITAQDCRPGYSCYQARAGSNVGYCWARSCEDNQDCRVAGDSCSNEVCDAARGLCQLPCGSNADCVGGTVCDTGSGRCYQPCFSELDWCGPDARCDVDSSRCVRKCSSDATCPAEHYCHQGGSTLAEQRMAGRCIAKCTDDSTCGGGEYCDRLGRCRPQCADDDACSSIEYCDAGQCRLRCTATSGCTFGQFCDVNGDFGGEPGRCRRDLRQTLVGNTCQTDSQCGAYHASCFRNSDFPGGYCTSVGCSEQEPCGANAACADIGGQNACLKRCDPDAANCRNGYACEERNGAHVCVPSP